MKKYFLTITLIIFPIVAFADAMPHGYQAYQFESTLPIDSIVVIESDEINFSKFDTVYYNPNVKVVECYNNKCHTSGHGNKKYQQVIIFSDSKKFISNIYEPEGSNPTFLVKQENNEFKVIETTSFLFKGKAGEILRALIITLLLELLVALFFFKVSNNAKTFLVITVVNMITIPLAWLTFPVVLEQIDSVIPLIFTFEILITLIEFIVIKLLLRNYSIKKILGFAVTANLVSFVVGGITFVITIFL